MTPVISVHEMFLYLVEELKRQNIKVKVFLEDGSARRVDAKIDGRDIIVSTTSARRRGDLGSVHCDKYVIANAVRRTFYLNDRYVMQTKRGPEGDARRCVEVMREAAKMQAEDERWHAEKEIVDSVRHRAETVKNQRFSKLDQQIGQCRFGLVYAVGRGFEIRLLDDDWELLEAIQNFLRERSSS